MLVGPVSFLLLAKAVEPGFAPLDLLDPLLVAYAQLLGELHAAGARWVQLDEPALAADRTPAELEALGRAYQRLGSLADRPKLLVSTYFGELGDALPVLADTPVEAIGLDFVAGPGNREALGAIGGIGAQDPGRRRGRRPQRVAHGPARGAVRCARRCSAWPGALTVSTSCSLLHVPLDLGAETSLAPELTQARVRPAEGRRGRHARPLRCTGTGPSSDPAADRPSPAVNAGGQGAAGRARATGRSAPPTRSGSAAQDYGLPPLPTTTIGSFPQTAEIRAARADLRAGRLAADDYEAVMRAEIDQVIAVQEQIGLDVLVHGEPERNDMVQYFAEQLDGFAATDHGWVQSYGTRYVRPPILHGDVSRPRPMTVGWARYAQSLHRASRSRACSPGRSRCWRGRSSATTSRWPTPRGQVALALRDEVADLEAAGIRIIQVDEPALREMLPLRAGRPRGLPGAGRSARSGWPPSGAADATQIHTHMCYGEFGEIIDAIAGLDADVITIEAARSRMEFIADLTAAGYARGIGPGRLGHPLTAGARRRRDGRGCSRRAMSVIGPTGCGSTPTAA